MSGRPEHLRRVKEELVAASAADPAAARRRPWVRARPVEGLAVLSSFEQYGRSWELLADEAADRGGGESGPSPLRYLLSGAAACLIGWIRKVEAERGEEIRLREVELRTTLDMRGENRLAEVPVHPPWFVAEVRLGDRAAGAEELVREALARCPLTALLARAVPVLLLLVDERGTVRDDRDDAVRAEDEEEVTR